MHSTAFPSLCHESDSGASIHGVARRPKLLQVIESTGAGVGKHVIDLALRLNLGEFDLSLAYSPLRADSLFWDGLAQAAQRGVQLFEVPMRRQISPKADTASFLRLRRLLADHTFDVVHAHGSKAGFLGRLAAKSVRRTPIALYTPHAISLAFSRKYWLPEKLAGVATDALVAVSESEKIGLDRFHLVPRSKLRCVTAGIDIAQVQTAGSHDPGALRREFNIPADSTVVGTVGRISAQKDPFTFLRAVPVIRQRGHNAHFIWIGDGDQKPMLELEAKRLGVDRYVRFIGYRADVPRLVAGFDIFALTSRYESFGYVTCEAMAMAKPVVATRVEGTIQLVEDGATGFLFESGDESGFADCLCRIFEDPSLGARMGAAGLERAKRYFQLDRMVAETAALYRQLLSERGWMFTRQTHGASRKERALSAAAVTGQR